jgi:N-acetylglucosamine-6-phosphate deacetylase
MTTVLAGAVVGRPAVTWIAFDGGHIVDVGEDDPPRGAIDLRGRVIAPGFIDLQVNGVGAIDFAVAAPDDLAAAARRLVTHGVTTFCPTVVSAPLATYPDVLARIAAARAAGADDDHEAGARIAGAHLEGPFLGDAPGAHDTSAIRAVDPATIDAWIAADIVSIVTLAPEADPGFGATRALAAAGIVVALGHTRASYDDARAAADAGARAVTHLFNGMAPLHHREPAVAGAALDDDRLTPTLIADLVHVHPAALRLAIARKRNVALVSDAVAVERGTVGSVRVVERDGAPRLPDGTLAGSSLTLDRAVRNIVGLGIPLDRAVEMAATIPANLLGLRDRGRVVTGARADVVVLDPHTVTVNSVWRGGVEVVASAP